MFVLNTGLIPASLLLTITLSPVLSQDYRVEKIDAPPRARQLSAELTGALADQGLRVRRGAKRTVCEVWLCKQWQVEPDFQPTAERLYPFSQGQLIGLLHFSRRGKDFRDQSVKRGWYTLRFGLQPVDGNHEGTSPTRDFLVLVDAEQDGPDKKWAPSDLHKLSAETIGSTHPAMLCLQAATKGTEPAIRHNESSDWWILHAAGRGAASDKALQIPLDLIVIGHATE